VPVLVLAACLGIGFAVAQACEFALIPSVTPAGRVAEVNGVVETARYAGFVSGPALGGLLAGLGGTSLAMALNAATFVLVALAAVSLRARRPAAPREHGTGLRARDGIAILFSTRELALAMTVAAVSLLFMSASIPADVFFVKDVLDRGDTAFGFVLTAWTVGMIGGAIVLAKRIPAAMLTVAALGAVVLQGAGKAAAALWLVYPFMVVCYFAGGLGHGMKNVAFRTLVHVSVPADRHGRAFAAYNGLRNAAEIAALLAGGVLVNAVGARGTLWLAGAVSALAGIVGLVALRRARASEPLGAGPAEAGASTIGDP
jgi:MFS family permease